MKKSIVLFLVSIENSKILKYHTFAVGLRMKMKQYLKKKNQLRY